jgi:hypothetical protein
MQGGKVGGQSGIVWASKPGYYAYTYGWPAAFLLTDDPPPPGVEGTTKRAVLTPGKETRLAFRMAPAATLRAKLFGPDGRPMGKTRIWLTGNDLPPGSSVLDSGETDAEGVWVAKDVRRGRFRLVIADPREQWGELELGSIRFSDPIEYAVEATVHAWSPTETHASLKVTRSAK